MQLRFLVKQLMLSVGNQALLQVEVSILQVLHLTAQQRVLHQVLLQVDLLHLVQVILHLEAQVRLLLDLLVILHPEPLVVLLAALLPTRHHLARVLPQVVFLAHLLLMLLPPVLVLPLHQALVHRLLMRLVEVLVRRQVTCLPQALVSLHLEVSTLVARLVTVLL